MSFSISLRRSPKPGALTAHTCSVPRSLLTTSVASASPSTSSAMMSSGLPVLADLLEQRQQVLHVRDLLLVDEDEAVLHDHFHALGSRSRSTATGSRGRTACPRPRRACVSIDLASSTVMTPSLPTFSMASAIMLPIVASPLARDGADLGDLRLALGGLRHAPSGASTIASTAASMPRLISIGLAPAVTSLRALGVDRLRQHGGGGGAVAGDVGGLGGDLLHHLRAHVLEPVLELDLLGDGDAVLGDRRRAPLLLDDDVAAARARG